MMRKTQNYFFNGAAFARSSIAHPPQQYRSKTANINYINESLQALPSSCSDLGMERAYGQRHKYQHRWRPSFSVLVSQLLLLSSADGSFRGIVVAGVFVSD